MRLETTKVSKELDLLVVCKDAQKGSFAAGGTGGLRPFPRTLLAVPGLRTDLGSEIGVARTG